MFVNPKMGMSFPRERDLEAKLLSQQHHSRHYCVSFPRYITGATFQVHYPSISRYILDIVICLLWPLMTSLLVCFEVEYLKNARR